MLLNTQRPDQQVLSSDWSVQKPGFSFYIQRTPFPDRHFPALMLFSIDANCRNQIPCSELMRRIIS